MTVLQLSIVAFTGFLCVLSFLLFYFQHKKEKRIHNETIQQTQTILAIYKKQIDVRQDYLNTYDFLKQNLKESLQPQPEIELFL